MPSRTLRRVVLALLAAAALLVPAAEGTPAQKARKTGASARRVKAVAGKAKVRKRHGRRERGQKAPAPERIREIQEALAKDGSYSGAPTGKWDAATSEAMRRFQAAHGLTPTGKLEALSLQKLGLGSEVAGVAAPMPPATGVSSTSTALPEGNDPQR
ncbi:MAG: peptidoglycan-binding protein [Acidobacteriia bacterium]|nr:peptidoglycan-binding protein [Terriglobia bacterium]